jgi:hypothetical protein
MHSIISILLIRAPRSSDKEENVTVTGGCYYFLLEKKIVQRFFQCHVFAQSPPCRRPSDTYPVNFTPLPICGNVSLAVLFCSNDNSCMISKQSYVYIYAYPL